MDLESITLSKISLWNLKEKKQPKLTQTHRKRPDLWLPEAEVEMGGGGGLDGNKKVQTSSYKFSGYDNYS